MALLRAICQESLDSIVRSSIGIRWKEQIDQVYDTEQREARFFLTVEKLS